MPDFFSERKNIMPPKAIDDFKDDMPIPKRKQKLPMMPPEERAIHITKQHELANQKVQIDVTWGFAFKLLVKWIIMLIPVIGLVQWILFLIAMGRNQ